MLAAIYIVLLTFKISAIVACLTLCFLIARMRLTPTPTYMLFACAFGLRLVAQLWSVFYIQTILRAWAGLSIQQMVIVQLYDAGGIACFLVGFLLKYHRFLRFGLGRRAPQTGT